MESSSSENLANVQIETTQNLPSKGPIEQLLYPLMTEVPPLQFFSLVESDIEINNYRCYINNIINTFTLMKVKSQDFNTL